MGKGLSYIDVHLLSAAYLMSLRIWTEDKTLRIVAQQLGLLDKSL